MRRGNKIERQLGACAWNINASGKRRKKLESSVDTKSISSVKCVILVLFACVLGCRTIITKQLTTSWTHSLLYIFCYNLKLVGQG